jgi:replication factor C large subunit
LDQVRGNDKAVSEMRKWATSWEHGAPKKKGLIIVGSHGTGKTSAALALANEFNWGVIELNASDARNAEIIKRIVMTGSRNETFTATGEFISAQSGGRKLIIMDEADYLFERIGGRRSSEDKLEKDMSDRGGKSAIIETLRKTQQPIILIANDLYELTRSSGAPLNQLSEVVKFQKLRKVTIGHILKRICELEGVEISQDAVDNLSRHADGDMRSAINDLQLLAMGRDKITAADLKSVGFRNVKGNIFDALRDIFHSTKVETALKAVWELDESPEDIILWLDENLPLEYRRPYDLMNGFNMLSRADIFLGRVRRRQHYGLWAYSKDIMTAGIALAKVEPYHGWVKYKFPSWLMQMSRTKQLRQLQKSTTQKLGYHCHTSREVIAQDVLPYIRYIYKTDHEFAVTLSINLEFTKEEISWMLQDKVASNKVKYLLSEIKKAEERMEAEAVKAGTTDKEVEVFPAAMIKNGSKSDIHDTESDSEKDGKNAKDSGEAEDAVDSEKDSDEKAEKKEVKKEDKKVQKNLFDY